MADPYAEFQAAPAAAASDPYAEFSPAPASSALPPQDPTQGMSSADKFVAGVGKSFVDTGRGVYQLGASLGHAAGLVSDEKMAQIQSGIDESKKLDAPLMNTTAGTVGDVVGQGTQFAAFGPESIAANALVGGGLAAAQPVATGQSRLSNAAIGAAGAGAGAAVGKVAGSALGGFSGGAPVSDAVTTLQNEGIPLNVAQTTGSKLAQHIDRASQMVTTGAEDFADQQGQALNRAVLKRVGVTDPDVTAATPDVLAAAKSKITGVMDDVASRANVPFDQPTAAAIKNVMDSLPGRVPASEQGPLMQNIADLQAAAAANNGVIPGTVLQRVNSNLGALTKNPHLSETASDLQDVLNDALTRSTSPEDAAALSQARQQYRALKQIEPAIDQNGDISPKKLMNSLSSIKNRNQTLYGQGDQSLVTLAKAAREVLPDSLGNSGTAERSIPTLTVLEALASGHPIQAAVKAGAGVVGVGGAARALRSQGAVGNILTNGIPGISAAAPYLAAPSAAAGFGSAGTLADQLGITRSAQTP